MFFFSRVSEASNKVENEVIPESFIGRGDSSLVNLVGQMIGVLMTPFIDRISFNVTQGQGGPLHGYTEELVSWVQHAYDPKLILELASLRSISIEIIHMAVYLSG